MSKSLTDSKTLNGLGLLHVLNTLACLKHIVQLQLNVKAPILRKIHFANVF